MTTPRKTIIHGARRPDSPEADFWVEIDPPFIARCGHGEPPAVDGAEMVDARGMVLLPGAIDCHVHFREPGMTAKATIASETRAAAAGGVTSCIDMPNTRPATTTLQLWQQKRDIAAATAAVNTAFFLGAAGDNLPELLAADYTQVPGVKVFMGSSTGSLLVDDDAAMRRVFSEVPALIAVHAEDQAIIAQAEAELRAEFGDDIPVEMHTRMRPAQACYEASALAVELARAHSRRLHICHITTAAELDLLELCDTPIAQKLITSEVTMNHLLFTPADYPRLGPRIKMNPSVKSPAQRMALRMALLTGQIDMLATDHAPHLMADKQGGALTAASGAPSVQFALPLLIDMMGPEVAERAYCNAPADVYRIDRRGYIREGYYADLALIDTQAAPREITDADVLSPCGWTPYVGLQQRSRVERVWVNGTAPTPASSHPLTFLQ